MRRWFGIMIAALLCFTFSAGAQEDAFNLPAELLVLLNDGSIERYGIGAAGVAQISPPQEEIVDFGLAPDGVTLAYRTQNALKLYHLITGATSELEGVTASFPPYRGRGQTVAWTPDGGALAYTTEYGLRVYFADGGTFFDVPTTPVLDLKWSEDGAYLAVESESNIWWVYRRDAASMALHAAIPASLGAEWVDTTVLMFAPPEGGLFLMDVGAANAQAQIADATLQYKYPVLRPDRSVALLAKRTNDTQTSETSGALHVASFDAQAGWSVQPVGETPVDAAGMRWTPDGSLLIKLSGGVLALVDPISAQGFTLPATGVVAYHWGVRRAANVATLGLSSDAFFLTRDYTGFQQVWQLPASGEPPVPVTASEADITAFDVAQDGLTLIYISDEDLKFLPAAADEPITLVEGVGDVRSIDLNSDASAAVYDAEGKVWQIDLSGDAGAAPVELLNGYDAPRYLGDDDARLLVRLPDADLGVYDFATRELNRMGAYRDAVVMASGAIVAAGRPAIDDIEGIYLVDLTGSAPPLLLYGVPDGRVASQITATGAETVRALITGAVLKPLQAEVIEIALSSGPTGITQAGFAAQPGLSPDGRYIIGMASGAGLMTVRELASGREALHTLASPASAIVWLRLR